METARKNNRIIGIMVVGSGEADRWLKRAIFQWGNLVDDGIICLNNVDKKTRNLIKKTPYWSYDDDREWGKEQYNMKTDLLKKASKLKPSWILAHDADEIYDKRFNREEAEKLMDTGAIGYYFAIINLWDEEKRYRHDLSFWNIRFYRFAPEHGLNFERKNLHCGLAPPMVYKFGCHAPFIVKHYGLMKKEDREAKIRRYEKYDPNAKYKGREYYDKLKTNEFVRTFNEDSFRERLVREVNDMDESRKYLYATR